jgi:hypothetical protein
VPCGRRVSANALPLHSTHSLPSTQPSRYALNVGFNLLNKSIFKYFPFPYTVSTVHVVVGTAYCALTYFIGLKTWSFGRVRVLRLLQLYKTDAAWGGCGQAAAALSACSLVPPTRDPTSAHDPSAPQTPHQPQAISKQEFGTVFGPAAMHAIGHIAANISFAAVAISLTHTVKTLEPAFNVLLSRLVLGEATPLPVTLTLIPIMAGVALASAGELSFNWTGFISAMLSNLTFGFRAVWGKA